MSLFVFGLGFSGLAIAREAMERGISVAGTVREADKAEAFRAGGIDTHVFDGWVGDDLRAALRHATHVVVSVPPGDGDPVLAAFEAGDMPALAWLGYLSTVGVYGDTKGAWVDETAVPDPSRPRSVARLAAEEGWRAFAETAGVPLAILRLAGIYGPGRNALCQLADGRARRVVKPGQVFNRIHVDDIARATLAAAERRADGVFNLADDEPAPPQDVVAFAAGLMGVAPPPEVPLEEAGLSPMARSFYDDNRRVANGRVKARLDIALRYPTYREGLTAMWRDGSWKG